MTGPGGDGTARRPEHGAGVPARPVHRVGDRALLVDCVDGADARGLHAALLADPLPGQGELLPGARTVLVRLAGGGDPGGAALALARALATVAARPVGRATAPDGVGAAGAPAASGGGEVVLDTVNDGPDRDAVAGALGVSVDALVRAHTDRPWTAAFVGFSPGFAYLEPDGTAWDVPRRSTPRRSVPAGSVAVAGPYAAVYPRRSPGGWQLLGRTDAVLWDLTRPQPALLTAGTRVRFRAVRVLVHAAPRPAAEGPDLPTPVTTQSPTPSSTPSAPPSSSPSPTSSPAPSSAPSSAPAAGLRVVSPGVLTLVEDLGRPGHLHLGVGPSGALDRRAAVRANRLVGNPRGAAVLETVLGGLTLGAHGPTVLAVTGAPVGLVRTAADGAPRPAPPLRSPFGLDDGDVLRLEPPAAGLRAYVAVRGGVAVEPVLGSRSTDVLAALGRAALAPGDVLPVGPAPADAVAGWPDPPDPPRPGPADGVEVRVVPGPRDDWVAGGVGALCDARWTAGPALDRVGVRLAGQPLARARPGELPSEGVVAGAVQVPPSGLPVVFLADHPVTGGYPVVAVVRAADLDRLAQVRPGDRVRFVVDHDGAHDPGPGPDSGLDPAHRAPRV